MKTLDEVIELCEKALWCAYLPQDDTTTTAGLALYYLREYREMKEHLACLDAVALHGEDTQIVNNPPLTWDELKNMPGKPVWVEHEGYTPGWEIVENNGAVRGSAGDFTGRFVETNMSILRKEEQGITWQAYRKER